MATGIDLGASVVTFISLSVALFQGCVKGIVIISEAQHVGRNVERVSLMLEWEQYRFLRWGERAGLCDPDKQPDARLNWELAHQLLSQLHDGLTNAETLRERYNLDPSDETQHTSPQTTTKRQRAKLLGRSWSKASEKICKSRSQYIQQQTSTFKKLKWVEMDEEKIRRLLTDISFFNNALQDLLDDRHQELMRISMEALMRDLLSRSVDLSDVETIKAFIQEEVVAHAKELEGASQVKETRLLLGVDKRGGENSTGQVKLPPLKRVGYEHITNLRPFGNDGSYGIGEYRVASAKRNAHSHVLLEWKRVDSRVETKIKNRIMELAYLLSVSSDASFHSLKCLGFLKRNVPEEGHDMYAYVFEIEDLLTVPRQPSQPLPFTLKSALAQPRKPSLSERLKICLGVSEAVLQLHTAGWLHKNIRPDNILFLSPTPESWSRDEYSGPYMSGFEFARNTLEETETMPFDDRQTLYKHPDLTEIGVAHRPFQKKYDLHSLGCVLLEIVLWSPLEVILTSVADTSGPTSAIKASLGKKSEAQIDYETRFHLRQTKSAILKRRADATPILDRVSFAAGDRLRDVVDSCFFPSVSHPDRKGINTGDSEGEAEDEDEEEDEEEILQVSVEPQMFVVDTLRSLCAAI